MKAILVYESLNFKRGLSPKDSLGLGYSGVETFRKMAEKHGYNLLDYTSPIIKKYAIEDEVWEEQPEFVNLETWEKEIEKGEKIFIDIIYKANTNPIEIILSIDFPRKEIESNIKLSFDDQWWYDIEKEGNKL